MRAPARLLPILLAGLLVAACAEPVATLPGDQADAASAPFDAGSFVDDAGDADAGQPPDAGDEPDAGEPDAGPALDGGEKPDAGPTPDAGSSGDAGTAPDAGIGCTSDVECEGGTCEQGECVPCDGLVCVGKCVDEQTDPRHCGACGQSCDAKESCIDGACRCPALGCDDLPECTPQGLSTTGCGACLTACIAEHEREELEVIADAFRSFRKDTGGWPYFETDWSVDDDWDRIVGGVDPTRFLASDVAIFSRGSYVSCEGLAEPTRCWYGPYLRPGTNLVSAPWLDAWGRVRLFALVPPEGVDGWLPSTPEGAVVIWSSGPDGRDQTGCTNLPSTGDTPCVRDLKKIATGEPSLLPSDDVIVFVGSSR